MNTTEDNNYEIEIDNYIKWFKEENSDEYGELKWLIDLLLNSKHKDNIIDVLKTTNEDYEDIRKNIEYMKSKTL